MVLIILVKIIFHLNTSIIDKMFTTHALIIASSFFCVRAAPIDRTTVSMLSVSFARMHIPQCDHSFRMTCKYNCLSDYPRLLSYFTHCFIKYLYNKFLAKRITISYVYLFELHYKIYLCGMPLDCVSIINSLAIAIQLYLIISE